MGEWWVAVAAVTLFACSDPATTPTDAGSDAVDAAIDAPPDAPEIGFRIGGTATGVRDPVQLALTVNGVTQHVPITEDGGFQFAHPIADGSFSLAFVGSAPCEINAPTATNGADVANVAINCDGVAELRTIGLPPELTLTTPLDPRILSHLADRWYLLDNVDPVPVSATTAYSSDTILINTTSVMQGVAASVPSGPDFTIRVDHAAAGPAYRTRTYAFTVGPRLTQSANLKGPTSVASDQFATVALSGDTLVVGAPGKASAAGAVYVFRRTGNVWAQEAALSASNSETNDLFGGAVAIDGNTIVVGAPNEDSSSTTLPGNNLAVNSGAAYVFTRVGTSWTQQAFLKAGNISGADEFGFSVAIAGGTIAIGAIDEDGSSRTINGAVDEAAGDAGAAYVFTGGGASWTQQAYIKAANADPGDQLGWSLSLSADTLVVGAPVEDSSAIVINGNAADNSASTAGAAYVFVRNGTTWSQQAYLKASNTEANDLFGISVTIDGDMLAVGATGEDGDGTLESNNAKSSAGAVYVYRRAGTTWTKDAYLKSASITDLDAFGTSCAIDRNHLVVGANSEDGSGFGPGATPDEISSTAGAVYVFRREPTWGAALYTKPSNTRANDRFGSFVALDGQTIAVGAPQVGAADSGAVYVFR